MILWRLVFSYRRLGGFLAVLGIAGLSMGCGLFRKEPGIGYSMESRFSVNVAMAQPGIPKDLERFPANQRHVLEERGVPDFIHLRWVPGKDVVEEGRVYHMKTAHRGKLEPRDKSWIYLAKDLEVLFEGETEFREEPLSDKMRVICEYGDPQDIRYNSSGQTQIVNWRYYSEGIIFRFQDEKLIETDRSSLRPIPNYQGR
ncbi:hypothetical protein HQ520_06905 [bacterium]|nr:hypothetical protein [bacterium]